MNERNLELYLEMYRGKSVDFFRFPGNFGDALIFHGTKVLFKRLEILPEYVELDSTPKNKTLVIDGGGNFVDYYSDVRTFLKKKANFYERVIILPHTIFGTIQIDLLATIATDVVIFCREQTSADYIERKLESQEVFVSHDCALYNDFGTRSRECCGVGILNAFRTDCESSISVLPSGNYDLSASGYATKPLDQFVDTIDRYQTVNTDRLHVAIAATLLGKNVKLYLNSYYKNEAVFNYSLRRFPNIVFIPRDSFYFMACKLFSSCYNETFDSKLDPLDGLVLKMFRINREIWRLEDRVRVKELGVGIVAETKGMIDVRNQERNDLIRAVDHAFCDLLNNDGDSFQKNLVVETPGMILDRLAILYIRYKETCRIHQELEESPVKEEYARKEEQVLGQMDALGTFLDSLLHEIERGERYFHIYDPIKIYNDQRIRTILDRS